MTECTRLTANNRLGEHHARALEGLAFVVPAYNEEETVATVVGDLKGRYPRAEIIVINDHSSDRTAARARAAGAVVLDMPFNVGIGGAVQTGFLYALRQGYKFVVQVDGDGQHPVSQVAALVNAVGYQGYNLAVGSRFPAQGSYRMPIFRYLGSVLLSRLITAITGVSVRDCTSGFRAYDAKALAYFAQHYPQDYPEPEAIVLSVEANLEMVEVGVEMNPRVAGISSINLIGSVYYMAKTLVAILVKGLRMTGEKRRAA